MLRTRGHTPASESAAIALGRVTEHAYLWHGLALAGAILDPPRRHRYLHTIRAVAATQFVTSAIKLTLRRDRPVFEDLPAADAHGVRAVLPLGPRLDLVRGGAGVSAAGRSTRWRPVVALSRPFLGLHYPSDTVAGAALGDALARLTP